jgi:hypothetical protein
VVLSSASISPGCRMRRDIKHLPQNKDRRLALV